MAFAQVSLAAAAAPSVRSSSHATALRRHLVVWLLLVAVAVATRCVYLGDPALGIDEDFYLLVGDRLWHGALPYVDIWDRKPFGLFLLYAALRPLSPDGILAYQIGALLFAATTAFVITRLARRFASEAAAVVGGCVYLVTLPILDGAGGQSPVFYNLFMASAALMIVQAMEAQTRDRPAPRRLTVGAMLLVGLALQLKTSAVVEGCFFGLWLLGRDVAGRAGWRRTLADGAMWMAAAAAPTLAAFGFYAAIGHADAYWQATVLAALSKHEPAHFSELNNLRITGVALAPLLLGWGLGLIVIGRRAPRRPAFLFLGLWSLAAIYGYFAIGHFYIHYAIPAVVPLAVGCAALAGPVAAGALILSVALIWNVAATQFPFHTKTIRHRQATEAILAAMAPYAREGCLYMNSGPPIVYLKARSCLPSRYVFPEHLSVAAEAETTGATREMKALLARRPSAILFGDQTYLDHYAHPRNAVTDAMVAAAVARDYRLAGSFIDPDAKGRLQLYVRADRPDAFPRVKAGRP